MLQIAHVYRDLGRPGRGLRLGGARLRRRGPAPEDAVMETYAQSTLTDSRARTLATQAEAAMRARSYADANALFHRR